MSNPELTPISEFDLITAPLEIDLVCEELGVMEHVIRDYPKLKSTFSKSKDNLLNDPAAFFVHQEKTRIVTEAKFPSIAKIVYEE